ncbi:MAG: Gfo/Idh/MocA family oxidoreductase [Gammaproteobacteria bacterium]|nr:Gfo/Idh/MocA family oxidoreductase [Gammaproteobacteria bacterium]
MANTFKWGIIGPGRIAGDFAGGFKAVSNAKIFAVASSHPQRGKKFAEDHSTDKIYNSYAALANDPDVDAVYIGTPHRFHFENARLCLLAGKPVLCEKPLTVNAAECEELIRISRERQVFLMEAVWSRYLPLYQQLREWLDNDVIGEVRLINSTFCNNVARDKDDRWFNHDLAGGALLDMGVYSVNLSQWIYGVNPESFVAQGYIGVSNVDEITSVIMHYGRGRMSQFTTSLITQAANDMLIYGSSGYIHIHPHLCVPTEATLFDGNREITVSKPLRANGYEYEIEEVIRCVQSGLLESPVMTQAETLANMRLMDDIRKQIGLRYRFESFSSIS